MAFAKPVIIEIAPDTYAINEFGLAAMYLLVGEQKALLIDTGCGTFDLKKCVAGLTDKPVTVAITHGHMDHVGGMGAFDEVYLNDRDVEMARALNIDELRDYAEQFGKLGGYQVYDYTPDAIQPIGVMPRFLPLEDGDVFDLGGRSVTAYAIPGHTSGGIVLLDEKNRVMFSGDSCNTNLLAPWCSVEKTLEGLRKFKALSDRFDRNYNGHIMYLNQPMCVSQPKNVADDLITVCEQILVGKGEPKPYPFLGHALQQMRYGCAGLSYDPKHIYE